MILKEQLVKLGVLAKPHGVAGEVLLRVVPQWEGYSPDPSFLFVDLNGGLVPFEVLTMREKNDSDLLVSLDTIQTGDDARALQGADVYIEEEALGEPGDEEVSLRQLIDYTVSDVNRGLLGKVTDVSDSPVNPLLQVDYNGKDVLIPFQADFIHHIDPKKRTISLQTPPGLIDLYLE
ncbi:ribosome maturation factor RimM [Geofilum sp. OHC36d9]|uniref:ribosome maturation factor RimM n=1 Tax=Geofilum sp. OHC36d9 TaxID=3458413 RepID=UPI004033EA45